MQKLLILQGIPASGKSFWAKKFVLENPSYVRVSRDDLRRMRGKYWIPEQESLITKWEMQCVANTLDEGFNVVLDATNLNVSHLKKWEALTHMSGKKLKNEFEIEYKKFDISLEEALARDAKRGDRHDARGRVLSN